MNDSQSSEVFSINTSFSLNDVEPMDTVSYESLLYNTKSSLSKDVRCEVNNKSFYDNFSSLLDDCGLCVTQSLDLVISLLESEDVFSNSVCEYMNNCASLLQLLSSFLKNVVECVVMSCHSMKTFPLCTAQIILSVFKHCKESEALYGINLSKVESQLKDIFRSCHELQLTYMMVLDKHFTFKLTETEEMDIFLEALEINLHIGELVQSLDVKTMAEQWKGVTLLCERYASLLCDKQVFGNCSKVLCKIALDNLETGNQMYQEEKVITRSLKVSCFAIKIVIKISNILKNAIVRDYQHILHLFCHIYLHNSAYLEITKRPASLANLVKTLVINPADILLKELVLDEQFIQCILQYEIMQVKKDDKILGFILLLLGVIRFWIQNNQRKTTVGDINKIRLLKVLLSCIPYCQVWFNEKQMKLKLDDNLEPVGFYNHVLIHAYSLCVTLNSQQYSDLEKTLFEAIMSVECWSALFASNLWALLARISSPLTTQNQVTYLCKSYQKLVELALFVDSPQEVHLRYLLKQLFRTLKPENKVAIYKEFCISEDKNATIWKILEVKNLPEHIAQNNLIKCFRNNTKSFLNTDNSTLKEIIDFIKLINLVSTCKNLDDVIPDMLELWMKICPDRGFVDLTSIDKRNVWYLHLFRALVNLTLAVGDSISSVMDLTKILHVTSAILETSNIPLSLLSIDVFYNLAKQDYEESHFTEQLLQKSLNNILNNETLASKLVYNIREDKKRKGFLAKVAKDKGNYQQLSKLLGCDDSTKDNNDKPLLFVHKCMENPVNEVKVTSTNSSCNFEFDIDSILDVDTSEPQSKKQKLQNEDIEHILKNIESDTTKLSNLDSKEFSSDDKRRIRSICNTLNSFC